MEEIQVEGEMIYGISTMTTNKAEMDLSTAKIGDLWQEFFSKIKPYINEDASIYGVYHSYISDYTGEFLVTAGSTDASTGKNLETIAIAGGKYLSFSKKGELPQAVIDLWGEVWTYFTSDDCSHERLYTTDFERYTGSDEVEICIAIK